MRLHPACVALLVIGCGGSDGSNDTAGDTSITDDSALDSSPPSDAGSDVATDGARDSSATDAPADGTTPAPKFLDGFFPIGVWTQPMKNFDRWKARGINTLVGNEDESKTVTIEAWSTAAEAAGLHMIRRPLTKPEDDLGKKLLLAWDLPDEPDNKATTETPASMKTQYDAWKKIDPTRPIALNFSGGNVWFATGSNAQCNGPGDGTATDDCYPAYIAAADWVGNDFYPIAGWDPPQDLALVGKIIDKLAGWSKGKPQFAFVETCDQQLPWAPKAGGPTADQLRGEIWDAIIHGARGITYFADQLGGGGTSFTWDGTPTANADELTKQNALITSLASVLQGEIDPSGWSAKVTAPLETAWRYDAGSAYFFVLNLSATAKPKQAIALTGTKSTSATLFGTTTTIPITASTITDDFAAYEVKIYVVK